jgi:hypothetical protein
MRAPITTQNFEKRRIFVARAIEGGKMHWTPRLPAPPSRRGTEAEERFIDPFLDRNLRDPTDRSVRACAVCARPSASSRDNGL